MVLKQSVGLDLKALDLDEDVKIIIDKSLSASQVSKGSVTDVVREVSLRNIQVLYEFY